MRLFLSDENKLAFKQLEQAIKALKKAKKNKLNELASPNNSSEKQEQLKLDYAAINEVLKILIVIQKHIDLILSNPFYSNEDIKPLFARLFNATNTPDEQNTDLGTDLEKKITDLIISGIMFEDKKRVYLQLLALGFLILFILSSVALAIAIVFNAPVAIIVLACCIAQCSFVASVLQVLVSNNLQKELISVKYELIDAGHAKTSKLKIEQYPELYIDSPVTPGSSTRYVFAIELLTTGYNKEQYQCHINIDGYHSYEPVHFLLSKDWSLDKTRI